MSEPATNPEPTLADHLAIIEKIVGSFPHPVEQTPRERAVIDRLVALLNRPVSITPPEPTQERAPDIARLMKAVAEFGTSPKATSHAVVAERMFDAMCCGAKAADLPFLATDRPLTLALIDLLFAKLADTREADAIEAAGDAETD